MAAAAARPQEASSSMCRCTYHAFLSFRGEDTRTNFTSHLYRALLLAGIHTFLDDDGIEQGENIMAELLKAIKGSIIYIIVFSKDYASSRWCLDELVTIMEMRRTVGHTVVPVFYHVDPSQVRKQTGSFAEAFARHEMQFKDTMDKVEKWRAALREVADLRGMVLGHRHESQFVQDIVEEIGNKLKRTILNVDRYLMGLDSRVKDINLWLQDVSNDVAKAMQYGIGGIGKTSIVKTDDNLNCRVNLNIRYWPIDDDHHLVKRQVSNISATTNWCADDVVNSESYIDAAFRSSRTNEAYLFMKNEYVLLNYAPGTTDDYVLNGPLLICDGFLSLTGTAFAEYGIDCAFGSACLEEAFIFSGNLCAVINYTPGTLDDKIEKGPMTIISMFPFLKGTVFESGVDAAFESTKDFEAYLFRGNRCARINYGPNKQLICNLLITESVLSLKNTIFESGIDAAFASHRKNEVYIFKKDIYTRIKFTPNSTNDYILGGVKKILPSWPSLRNILPRKNSGLDVHDHSTPEARDRDCDRDRDEL